MKSSVYKLTCITNMHVGNGDINFSVIDNEVEKDVVTGYPTIHSSGVKGALREFLKDKENEEKYFGSKAEKVQGTNQSNQPGHLKFLSAHMIARPMRASEGDKPYILVATNAMLMQARDLLEALGLRGFDEWDTKNGKELGDIKVEECTVYKPNNSEKAVLECFKLDNEVKIMKEEDFKSIDLPVLARNKLDNGKSVNLWYEEIVPYKSVFFFCVLENEQGIYNTEQYLDEFMDKINGKLIQFGGNATIGYGLSKVEKMDIKEGK